ncbi:hypothetical protein CASFOL_012499 [Castilleja foliolosa]|uniref:F-box associated beta-propeller type 1 domain-containing protein n=1 Tax=Castilleja foliolosa TaxID=1961234 RepID=A0ABD3DIK3_9LAMI
MSTEIMVRRCLEMKSKSGMVDDKTSEDALNRFDKYSIPILIPVFGYPSGTHVPYTCTNNSSSLPSIPKMKLLLRRCQTNECPSVDYFSKLCTENDDKDGLRFSLKENYCFRKHSKYPSSIVGSCKGILCLEDFYKTGNIVLWNPVTDELKSLPPSSIECPPDSDSTSFFTGGFVFDARSEDFKVLRHVLNGFAYDDGSYKSTLIQAELYSLKNDSWRRIVKPEEYQWPRSSLPISLNGSCYWKAFDCVVSFNFAEEVFSSLPLPGTNKCNRLLFDMDGKLGSFVITRDLEAVKQKRFDILLWESNKWRWSKVYSFVVKDGIRPLGFWGRDKCFLQGRNRQLLVFDLTTQKMMPLDMEEFSGAQSLVSFEESTVSISKIENNLQSSL